MVDKESISSCTLVAALCSDSVLKSMSDYHDFIQNFTNLCLSDSENNILLGGPAYDSLPPFYRLFDFGSGQLIAKPSICAQYAFAVNKSCAVLEDPTVEYKQEYKALLYAEPAKEYCQTYDPAQVILQLSTRTHSVINREVFGTHICECVIVRNDLDHVPRFYLSSLKTEEYFQKINTQLLHYQLPDVQMDIRQLFRSRSNFDSNRIPDNGHSNVDDAGLWHESDKLNIGALKKVPAFRCVCWPLCALPWMSRHRIWPNNSLIQDVVSSTVLLKPSPTERTLPKDSHLDEENVTAGVSDLLWTFDFSIQEVILLSHIGTDAKRVFFLLQAFIGNSAKLYTAIKHVLLWSMEEHGPDLNATASTLNDKLMLVISKLEEFMVGKGVPHYFIPESIVLDPEGMDSNYICHIFGTEKSSLDDMLLSTTGLASLISVKDLTFCSNIMFKAIQEKLYSATEHNSKMLCMQLYQKLHSFDTAWKSIEAHHQAINKLEGQSDFQFPVLQKAIMDFLHSSLGGMYFVQGLQTYYKQEKRTFFNKGEEHFAAVQSSDMIVNHLRKALMMMKRELYQVALDGVEELYSNLYAEILAKEMEDQKMPDYETDVPFVTGLQNAAIYAVCNLDYLIMKIERPTLPRQIAANMSLAEFQLLGYTSHPVAVLDTAVLCGIIVSYCYSSLKRYTDAKKALEKVEGMSLKDEADLNERRGCFYLNVIAHAYKKAKDAEQAKYLLERSLTIMSTARNPARWALLSLNTKQYREYLWGGIGIAVATTIAAVTINFMFNKK